MSNLFQKKQTKWFFFALSVYFLVFQEPYGILLIILLLVPVFTILAFGFNNSSFKVWYRLKEMDDGKHVYKTGSLYNVITWILAFRVIKDFDFEDSAFTYYPLIIVTAMIIIIAILPVDSKRGFWQARRIWKPKLWLFLMLKLNILLYLFTATYGLNSVLDYSEPVVNEVKVERKYARSGRRGRKTYYIFVTPWKGLHTTKKLKVKKKVYDMATTKGTISVNHKKGLFAIPWYYLDENPAGKRSN